MIGSTRINYRPRLLTPTVGVSNRHKVATATDSLSITATNKLLPPTRSVTLILPVVVSLIDVH